MYRCDRYHCYDSFQLLLESSANRWVELSIRSGVPHSCIDSLSHLLVLGASHLKTPLSSMERLQSGQRICVSLHSIGVGDFRNLVRTNIQTPFSRPFKARL